MNLPAWIAVVSILLVLISAARRIDVRLALIVGAIPVYLTVGKLPALFVKIVAEMSNPGTVVPIGSAMGFAYVLRETRCDQHLVRLLLLPVRRVNFLLLPGGIATCYLVNTAIVSQAGTAAVIGPILLPLLHAGGISPARAGAMLLLGSSMGGELFNPGAVEMRKLSELTGLSGSTVVSRSAWLNLSASAVALLVFWLMTPKRTVAMPEAETSPQEPPAESQRVHPLKAIVPLIPLVLLFIANTLGASAIPKDLVGPPTILIAMFIGVAAAAATTPQTISRITPAFFEGAGYAYTHVISLIVAASAFAEGVKLSGLIEVVTKAAMTTPAAANLLALVLPWCLAVVSGTGIAPAISVMEIFVPAAGSTGIDPVRLGTLSSMGAHFGRTMSPAAAVVAMSARLSETPAIELVKLVTIPLLAGGVVLLLAALLGPSF